MSSYLVGQRIKVNVNVTDTASSTAVNPASFEFRVRAPASVSAAPGLFTWNGASWTSTGDITATATKGATGAFDLAITIPYDNAAKGTWVVGWKSTANGSGLGEGSGSTSFVALASPALEDA
jgi:hypothetical protein